MNKAFENLREKHDSIIYESFDVSENDVEIVITFTFVLGETTFHPTHTIAKKNFEFATGAGGERMKNLIFHLGLVELISYWKCACPKTIQINCGRLNEEQQTWWKKLFFHGLGEFFYLNEIEISQNEMFEFSFGEGAADLGMHSFSGGEGNLIPVGGGKDSSVTLELIRDMKSENTPFVLYPPAPKASLGTIKVAEYTEDEVLEVKRVIDPNLIALNKQGYLNGHTPFDALLVFLSTVLCGLLGKKHIVHSLEQSANEPTVPGTNINHQYSKSFEFESDVRQYIDTYLTREVNYFSILRPLHEIHIAEILAQFPQYLPVFRSCNRGLATNSWCGECPKCLFTYIMLAPLLKEEKLIEIFGSNLLDNTDLESLLYELIGVTADKPFECVGTRDEVRYALNLLLDSQDPGGGDGEGVGGRLLDIYQNLDEEFRKVDEEKIRLNWDDHFIPEEFLETLKNHL